MKNRALSLLIIPSILALGCAAPAAESTALTDEDVAAIRESHAEMGRLWLAGDWETATNHLAEEATLMPPNAPPIVGRADILASYRNVTVTEFDLTLSEIVGRDDLAYTSGEYRWTIAAEGVDEAVTESGSFIMIWRKQPDSTWLVTHDIWNYNGE